jgi:hypothetical protein
MGGFALPVDLGDDRDGSVEITTLSLFGELVVLALIQIGGFGIMTIGSVLALVTLRRVGLRQRMLAQAEIGAVGIGELSRLLWATARITVIVEGTLAVVAPASIVGVPLGESNLRRDHRVTIVCHKPAGSGFTHAGRETVLAPSDLIVVAGSRHHIEAASDDVG